MECRKCGSEDWICKNCAEETIDKLRKLCAAAYEMGIRVQDLWDEADYEILEKLAAAGRGEG